MRSRSSLSSGNSCRDSIGNTCALLQVAEVVVAVVGSVVAEDAVARHSPGVSMVASRINVWS